MPSSAWPGSPPIAVSFAEDVRAELCETLPRADHCRLAQLAGLLRFAGAFHLQGRGDVHVRLDLGSPAAARRAVSLLRERGATCEVRTYHERRFAEVQWSVIRAQLVRLVGLCPPHEPHMAIAV